MYKNSKFTILLPLIVAATLVIGIVLGRSLYQANTNTAGMATSDKINSLMQLIETRYVDTISEDSLAELAIPLILSELDPHSVYIPAKDLAETNESLDGQFDGIGVVFNMLTDTIVVLNVVNGGPSAKSGIEAGDRIIRINDSLVAGVKMDQNKVVKQLRGERGSKVNLGIERDGVRELVPITVIRGIIPIKSIYAAFMIAPKVGFVKFSQFSRNSHDELLQAISTLKEQGMKELILDIRNNTGGFLDQAILITNEFLPANKLIVYTKDRNGKETKQYSDGKGRFQELDLRVLLDEGSASSSEILAGALQDNDRGTIIGRRSYGKGLVQEQISFRDGSAVRLTVARYYTPSGRSIQKPYDKGAAAYQNDLNTRFEHNEFFSADSIHFADSLKFTTVGGRTVYGGGGIMPDLFVPADTTDITPYLQEILMRNTLYKFTIEYADKNRTALNAITTIKQLDAFYAQHPNLLNEFVQYAAAKGIEPKPAQIERSKKILLAQLKATIGRNTALEENAFYNYIYPIDSTIESALNKK